MEFLIVRGLSSILEAGLWSYFIISIAKIISKEDIHFSKKQIALFFISLVALFEIGCLTRGIFTFFNLIVIYPAVFLLSVFLLKLNIIQSISIIVTNIIALIITELIAVFTTMSILKIDSNTFVNSWIYLTIALTIQYTLFFAIVKITNTISKNKTNFRDLLESINTKTVITVLSILALCICPQFIIYVINKYNYPTHFLFLN